MNKNNKVVKSITDTSTLVRAKFGPGMLLQHEDLEQLNVYTRELSRLLFKSFFGCGVICGLIVKVAYDECNKLFVSVSSGLALDGLGDPVYVQSDKRFALDDKCNPDISGPLWVMLCATTKNCAPRTSMCADDDDKSIPVCTRERDMFEIRVVNELPKCVCGCDKPGSARDNTPGSTPPAVMEHRQSQQGSVDDCLCADPACHTNHYAGKCECNCGDGSNCVCECILLARLENKGSQESPDWVANHSVRRFIRPVLMRDPQVVEDGKRPSHHDREREEAARMEMRREHPDRDPEFEIQHLQGQVSDSAVQAQKLSQELEDARKQILDLRMQYADLERTSIERARTPEQKNQPAALRKAPKKPEENA